MYDLVPLFAAEQVAVAQAAAWALTTFLDRCGYWQDGVAVHTAGLATARRLTDLWMQAHTHRELALAYVWLGRHDEARTHLGTRWTCSPAS